MATSVSGHLSNGMPASLSGVNMKDVRVGANSYWLSDDSWSWFKSSSDTEGISIRGFIERHCHEWTSKDLYVRDDALRDLWINRIAQGAGHPHDGVLYTAMYTEWGGRWMHSLDLTAGCVEMLALWTVKWGLPHKMRGNGTAVGLAAIALEMIGRGWLGDSDEQ